MYKKMFCLVMVLGLASVASAAANYWVQGGATDNLWTSTDNWSLGAAVGTDDLFIYADGDTAEITSATVGCTGNWIRVGDNTYAGSASLTVSGGSLVNNAATLTDLRTVATGTISQSGGSVTVQYINVGVDHNGVGLYEMSSGIAQAGWHIVVGAATGVGSGTVNLSGDSSMQAVGNFVVAATGLIDIQDTAELKLPWNHKANAEALIAAGKITAWGGMGTPWITQVGTYDPVTITPEPMTIALLGLGGLFLRRRKK